MEITQFFEAIWRDWVARVSGIGSVVLLVLGLWPFYDKPIPRWIVLNIGLACFFFAAASVWTDEHRLRIQKEKELEQLSIPQFKAEFRAPVIVFPANKGKDTTILMNAHITNLGAPSIADRFSTRIIFFEGREVFGVGTTLPPPSGTLTFQRKTGQSALVFSMQDYLPRKALIQPIPRNAVLSGFLLALFRDVPRDSLYDGKTKLVISCQDVGGRNVVAEHSFDTDQDNADIVDASTLQSE
jgi:hypothetical protein